MKSSGFSNELKKPRVYIETTIPSFLIALASRDIVIAARQQITQEWWYYHRQNLIYIFHKLF